MAKGDSQASKKEALKRKLQSKAQKATKPIGKKHHAPQHKSTRQLAKALLGHQKPESANAVGRATASTKHSAGRRDVCQSLDRATMDRGVSESLRGIGGRHQAAAILTQEQLARRARQEREDMAVVYETHQAAVSQTVDGLAQLMSGSGS
ncbi:hypothetical protein GGI04_002706 [Coemansia thaxteri]|uniref:Uncharacterized protein n=1 Tax=Coemansia thaxteri TaxID=2663907 RepID=A0A9W8BG10_9FUNG|nr:hypothetical protein GGI04_002706 [Coemansia thaxteri]KAJ2007384.1 hypothetical protein H4R26_000807 [Coemansia thaxteri]KAJ2464155.1 hypothetical protein EV174_006850 [Coemansia sp. RSA 2320]KAJ2470997.1 hypothetical protein GGI02_002559 [Coemansia sp. RSA 2322]